MKKKKKIVYVVGFTGDEGQNDYYIYKKYGPGRLHSTDTCAFNTLKEAKDWAIKGYRSIITDAQVGITNIKEYRKDTVPWDSGLEFDYYEDEEG